MTINWTLIILAALLLAAGIVLVALGQTDVGIPIVSSTVTLVAGSFIRSAVEREGAS